MILLRYIKNILIDCYDIFNFLKIYFQIFILKFTRLRSRPTDGDLTG